MLNDLPHDTRPQTYEEWLSIRSQRSSPAVGWLKSHPLLGISWEEKYSGPNLDNIAVTLRIIYAYDFVLLRRLLCLACEQTDGFMMCFGGVASKTSQASWANKCLILIKRIERSVSFIMTKKDHFLKTHLSKSLSNLVESLSVQSKAVLHQVDKSMGFVPESFNGNININNMSCLVEFLNDLNICVTNSNKSKSYSLLIEFLFSYHYQSISSNQLRLIDILSLTKSFFENLVENGDFKTTKTKHSDLLTFLSRRMTEVFMHFRDLEDVCRTYEKETSGDYPEFIRRSSSLYLKHRYLKYISKKDGSLNKLDRQIQDCIAWAHDRKSCTDYQKRS